VESMDGHKIRRPRGTSGPSAAVLFEVDAQVKHKVETISNATSLSLAIVEEMIIAEMPDVVAAGSLGSVEAFRASRVNSAVLANLIPLGAKQKVTRLKKMNGPDTTISQVFDFFVRRISLGPDGVPVSWAPKLSPGEPSQQPLAIPGLFEGGLPATGT